MSHSTHGGFFGQPLDQLSRSDRRVREWTWTQAVDANVVLRPIDGQVPRHAGGTLPYMSPEAYRAMMGQPESPEPASDIYGVGVMLFEFVTGRLPYATPASPAPIDLESALEARRGAPDWRPEDRVTAGLRSIIDRC